MDTTFCIIESDRAVSDSIRAFLRASDYNVQEFTCGANFLNFLALHVEKVEAIICAAELPDTTGIKLFNKLSIDGSTIPYALIQNRANPTQHVLAVDVGILWVLRKPLMFQQLRYFSNTVNLRESRSAIVWRDSI